MRKQERVFLSHEVCGHLERQDYVARRSPLEGDRKKVPQYDPSSDGADAK